ncbi:MAG: redox-regulated ATPase YchF [Chloroflexota bacterium]
MSLSIGLVGLPNVGKSTTFNALTKEQNAVAANYPFATIEPNKAIVPVPDKRVDKLTELSKSVQTIYATIEFVDVAGLVKGASQGEGLGNKFLGNIRDVDAILHVVRCFEDENVVHVSGEPDPRSDIEIINTELILADLQQLEKKHDRLQKQSKADKEARAMVDVAAAIMDYLGEGKMLTAYPDRDTDGFIELNKEMRFLTAKPIIFGANVSEDDLEADNDYVNVTRQIAEEQGGEVIKLSAKLEEDMAGMSDEERTEYLELAGIETDGLDQIIRKGYRILGLQSYFTTGEKESRAWTIREGWTAPQAAGVIHTDFERGFIRAEVSGYNEFVELGGWGPVKDAGKMRLEGRDYVVKDGDVILFRFNV